MKDKSEKKLNIIHKSLELCSQCGFIGTSMDQITSHTGVSKATIYKYFKSKENLIAEALSILSEETTQQIESTYHDGNLSLEQKLTLRFTMLISAVKQKKFYGCYFLLAHSEYNQVDKKIGDICKSYKIKRLKILTELLHREGISDATEKAEKAEIIFNGLICQLQITGNIKLIETAKTMYLNCIIQDQSAV